MAWVDEFKNSTGARAHLSKPPAPGRLLSVKRESEMDHAKHMKSQ